MKSVFELLGIGITSAQKLKLLREIELDKSRKDIRFLRKMDPGHLPRLFELIDSSKAQLRQDLFVLSMLGFKRDGFFVEIGAADGIHNSNSYLLEFEFGWNGILVEPNSSSYEKLSLNRKFTMNSQSLLWSNSNETLSFSEVKNPELSTISRFTNSDMHGRMRRGAKVRFCKTVSLEDLLVMLSAPEDIDFLSIDTEGAEYEILKDFNFSKYKFKVICVEHNFQENRQKVFELLIANGYLRVFEELSEFDDWYVRG